jgi:hypothetical protein
MATSQILGTPVLEYVDGRESYIDPLNGVGLRVPEWMDMSTTSPFSFPATPAGQLRVLLLGLAGPIVYIYIACPVFFDKLRRGVEQVLGLPEVHFELYLGAERLDWQTCRWRQAAEVDVTVVRRPLEMVTEVLHVREQIDYYYSPDVTRPTEPPVLIRSMDVLTAILPEHGGNALFFASEELRSNREVVLRVVRDSGIGLSHATVELQDDREIVEAAVQNEGRALEFASERLKNDAQLVYVASLRKSRGPAELGTRIAREQLLAEGHLRIDLQEDTAETPKKERIAKTCAQSHTRACTTATLGQPYRFFSAAFAGCVRCVRRYIKDGGDPAASLADDGTRWNALDWAIFGKEMEGQDTDWVIGFLEGKGVVAIDTRHT